MSDVDGFIVAGYSHGRLAPDWDGEIHTGRDAADLSLIDCHKAGYAGYSLFSLVAVTPEAHARKEAADARAVEQLRQLAATSRKTVRVEVLRSIIQEVSS